MNAANHYATPPTAVMVVCRTVAVGCADLEAPGDAWVERSGDRTTVSCNKTSQSWHLVCKGTMWVGPQTHDCRHGTYEQLHSSPSDAKKHKRNIQ